MVGKWGEGLMLDVETKFILFTCKKERGVYTAPLLKYQIYFSIFSQILSTYFSTLRR